MRLSGAGGGIFEQKFPRAATQGAKDKETNKRRDAEKKNGDGKNCG